MKTYILRNKITGLFLNETNFSEENANKAKRITGEISEVGIKAIWGANAQVIEITAEQIAKLDLSDELEARAEAHRREAREIEKRLSASYSAGKNASATRLRRRAIQLAVEVYSAFPKWGFAA